MNIIQKVVDLTLIFILLGLLGVGARAIINERTKLPSPGGERYAYTPAAFCDPGPGPVWSELVAVSKSHESPTPLHVGFRD